MISFNSHSSFAPFEFEAFAAKMVLTRSADAPGPIMILVVMVMVLFAAVSPSTTLTPLLLALAYLLLRCSSSFLCFSFFVWHQFLSPLGLRWCSSGIRRRSRSVDDVFIHAVGWCFCGKSSGSLFFLLTPSDCRFCRVVAAQAVQVPQLSGLENACCADLGDFGGDRVVLGTG